MVLGKEGKVRSLPTSQMRQLMEAYIGQPPALPPIDFDSQSQFIEAYMKAGAPEFRIAFIASSLGLMLLSILRTGKRFSRLAPEAQQEFLSKCLNSHNPLMRGMAVLPGLAFLMSYYRRPECAAPLGFDSKALKEEAELRKVSRDRDLPTKGESQ
jgi:hypothetical protein